MDARGNEADLSELFAHQEWVRALALRLCGDHASADDLVQDTWIEALRGRSEVNSVRAWLGGIVRHRWRRDRLRSSARAQREASVARSAHAHQGEMPSPEGLFAQAELQRRVLAAVASLEEAARTVVLLRYYEGLSSEAIAARLGEPASTVRNRLARAHEKLRRHLDGEYGDNTWSALLIAASIHHLTPIQTGIGIAMKMKLAATVVILAAGSAWIWRATQAREQAAIDSETALARSTEPIGKPVDAAIETKRATQAPAGPTAAIPAEHRDEALLLFGSIEGPTPEQAEGSSLRLVETDGSSRNLTVGANAMYSAFGLRPGTAHIHVSVRGFAPKDDEIVLPADSTQVQHDLVLTPAFVVPVRFVDHTTGKPLLSARELDGPRISVIATRDRPTHVPNVMGRLCLGGDAGTFQPREPFGRGDDLPEGYEGVLEVRPPLPAWADLMLRDTVLDSRLVHGNEKEIVFEIDRADVAAAMGSAKLRCVETGSGKPVEGANVTLGFQDGGQQRGTTNAQGEVKLAKLSPGLQRLEITKPDMAHALRIVQILSREATDLGTVELAPGASVTGHVLDSEGRPLDARVTVFPSRPGISPRTVECHMSVPCGAGGAFDVKNVERGPSRIVVEAKGFAMRVIDANTADLPPLEVRMEHGTTVRFHLARDTDVYTNFMLADANGLPIRMEGASRSYVREATLAPGRYQLWSLDDDRIVRRESFEVGVSVVMQEVR